MRAGSPQLLRLWKEAKMGFSSGSYDDAMISGFPAVGEYLEMTLDLEEQLEKGLHRAGHFLDVQAAKAAIHHPQWHNVDLHVWEQGGELVLGVEDDEDDEAAYILEYGLPPDFPATGLLRTTLLKNIHAMEKIVGDHIDLMGHH